MKLFERFVLLPQIVRDVRVVSVACHALFPVLLPRDGKRLPWYSLNMESLWYIIAARLKEDESRGLPRTNGLQVPGARLRVCLLFSETFQMQSRCDKLLRIESWYLHCPP
jgi:hypothetical protein